MLREKENCWIESKTYFLRILRQMRNIEEALKYYRSIVSEGLKETLKHDPGCATRGGIFSSVVVIWLMIFQRLNEDHSLSAAVDELRAGRVKELLDTRSKKAQSGKISGGTGSYSNARSRLLLEEVNRVADAISTALINAHGNKQMYGYKIYTVDGSTVHIPYTEENLEKYPQYSNQYGNAHYPLVRIGVATDALTGVALRPSYGAYNGDDSTNELKLAEEILERIPKGSIVIGDRYFGCARFVSCAIENGLEAICRVKESHAKRYIGSPKTLSGDISVQWQSNRSRTGDTYSVKGRFIWHTLRKKGCNPIKLILFTTLKLPIEKVVELYGLRWNVETDLRDIKTTLGLDFIYAKTPGMVAKEIVLGVAAYNLVQHVIVASAKILKVSPRELSFKRVLQRIRSVGSVIYATGFSERSNIAFNNFIIDLTCFKLPKRNKPRISEPRKVWRRGRLSYMSDSRLNERLKLKKLNPSNTLHTK